jgi:hypothetical protein
MIEIKNRLLRAGARKLALCGNRREKKNAGDTSVKRYAYSGIAYLLKV